jgi:ribosomal protein S27AE
MSEQNYPVYKRLSAQKLNQINSLEFGYDPTDDLEDEWLSDKRKEPQYCPRCRQYSVFWGNFDEVWYCNNCDDF